MKLNWNFLGGQGVQNKKPSVGGVWIFSGTPQLNKLNTGTCRIHWAVCVHSDICTDDV